MESNLRRLGKLDNDGQAELSYDPDDVNIRLQTFRVGELIQMVTDSNLDILEDDFEDLRSLLNTDSERLDEMDIDGEDDLQRNRNLWDAPQKSRFIESLMIKLPIPLFYFDGSRKPWRVVDGLQRLNTIVSFIKGEFRLTDLEYLKDECEKLKYSDDLFPPRLKRRIYDAEIISYVINPGTPPEVKYNIFKRINTGGLKLNGQEIRNAFFRGGPAELTKELARSEEFILATGGKVSSRRMVDREYVNRFIAFQIFNYEEYNGKMDLFLSRSMNLLFRATNDDLLQIRELFKRSMKRSFQLFGNMSFRRQKSSSEYSKQPNKALFDTISWNLVQIGERDFEYLNANKINFNESLASFLNSEQMYKAINDTTGSKTAIRTRFLQLQNFINAFLNDQPYTS
ncbi:DUF262 domain-containing protein [Chitinophaga sp. RAB17]|uniref:DUF262 domain-containing protein n=1 Tax=Chitinophaga sp. RAB17 TaxID=3233049 RepID=UPI003F8F5714